MESPSEEASPETDDRLLEIKQQIENQLLQRVSQSSTQALVTPRSTDNIVGVGLGVAGEDSSMGLEPGTRTVNVYLVEPLSVDMEIQDVKAEEVRQLFLAKEVF